MLKFFINLIRGVNTKFFSVEWWKFASFEEIMSAIYKAKRKDMLATDECKATALMYATWAISDPAIIKYMIELGANVNAKDEYGRTVLMHAATHNNPTIIRMLIEHGIGVNTKDKDGWTALMHATMWNGSELIQALIECGADVNAKDKDGWTALMRAVTRNNSKTIQTLIKCGADVNAKDKDGWTALMHAASRNNSELVQALIEYGADVDATDKNGWTALKYTKFWNCSSKIIKMLRGSLTDVNTKNNNEKTLLLHAEYQIDWSGSTKSDTKSKVKNTHARTNSNYQKSETNSKNIRPTKKNAKKKNLTDKSVSCQNRNAIKSPYQEKYDNLIAAIQSNDVKKVKSYARPEYINIHNSEHYSFTPIMYAITKKDINPEIISILLSEGANVYERYKTEAATHTALELAVLQNNEVAFEEICDFLDIPDETKEKLHNKLNISGKNQYQNKHNIGFGNHDVYTMGTWYKGNEKNIDDIDDY